MSEPGSSNPNALTQSTKEISGSWEDVTVLPKLSKVLMELEESSMWCVSGVLGVIPEGIQAEIEQKVTEYLALQASYAKGSGRIGIMRSLRRKQGELHDLFLKYLMQVDNLAQRQAYDSVFKHLAYLREKAPIVFKENRIFEVLAFSREGDVYLYQKKYAESLRTFNQALQIFAEDFKCSTTLLCDDADSAVADKKKKKRRGKKSKEKLEGGAEQDKRKEIDNEKMFLEQMIEKARCKEEMMAIYSVCSGLGQAHFHLEQYEVALNECFCALKSLEKTQEKFGGKNLDKEISGVWQKIGKIYCELEKYDDALTYYQKALLAQVPVKGRHVDFNELLNIELNMAQMFLKQGNYEHAQAYFDSVVLRCHSARLSESDPRFMGSKRGLELTKTLMKGLKGDVLASSPAGEAAVTSANSAESEALATLDGPEKISGGVNSNYDPRLFGGSSPTAPIDGTAQMQIS